RDPARTPVRRWRTSCGATITAPAQCVRTCSQGDARSLPAVVVLVILCVVSALEVLVFLVCDASDALVGSAANVLVSAVAIAQAVAASIFRSASLVASVGHAHSFRRPAGASRVPVTRMRN